LSAGLPIIVLRRANQQIIKASDWWQANRSKAPQAFEEAIESAFDLLSFQPNVGVKVSGTRLPGVRRLHLSPIRYYLYYRVSDAGVEILSLWHTSRGSEPRF
jgi:plasmid stabilization system protein ParE